MQRWGVGGWGGGPKDLTYLPGYDEKATTPPGTGAPLVVPSRVSAKAYRCATPKRAHTYVADAHWTDKA